ncbi:MAG: HAMP domain-containing sensor histidine kinase [Betaproteobacteria bacterium]|nr:HAMP domain-containing sensor histidine kinase [Betaproteobacteria bacterium]
MVVLRRSVTTQLALAYGLVVAASVALVSAALFFGTIGVLNRAVDAKIERVSNRLMQNDGKGPAYAVLARRINRLLADGINSDTEIYLLLSPGGRPVAGNISTWPDASTPFSRPVTRHVIRVGRPSLARIIVRRLPGGARLFVGSDLRPEALIHTLVVRALIAGAGLSLILVVIGTVYLRRQIERRIAEIGRTAREIEAGDLTRRVPSFGDDEFGRLGLGINRMLDRIENLMDGVRHVSNAIAHDLRTPLARVRARLEEALRPGRSREELSEAATEAIEGIDTLIRVFEKLLQIAEAESGMRTRSFETVDLNRVVHDMVELYDAMAEQEQVGLTTSGEAPVLALGDRDLLANAVASLIDNAIKYGGAGAQVQVSASSDSRCLHLTVQDNGPGIPSEEIPRVTERFYRLDQSRSLSGNGLGLSIVRAIATLHGGWLELRNACPGLVARIVLPTARDAADEDSPTRIA